MNLTMAKRIFRQIIVSVWFTHSRECDVFAKTIGALVRSLWGCHHRRQGMDKVASSNAQAKQITDAEVKYAKLLHEGVETQDIWFAKKEYTWDKPEG